MKKRSTNSHSQTYIRETAIKISTPYLPQRWIIILHKTTFKKDTPIFLRKSPKAWAGIFKHSMGARNRVGIGLLYLPARLHRLAEWIPLNRFLGSLKFGLCSFCRQGIFLMQMICEQNMGGGGCGRRGGGWKSSHFFTSPTCIIGSWRTVLDYVSQRKKEKICTPRHAAFLSVWDSG
jgi:hypothetical protein